MTERGKNDTLVAVTRGNVTRSLGEDVHVVLVEKKRSNVRIDVEWSPTTRTAMVADNFADMPLVFAVMVRRRSFFQ